MSFGEFLIQNTSRSRSSALEVTSDLSVEQKKSIEYFCLKSAKSVMYL